MDADGCAPAAMRCCREVKPGVSGDFTSEASSTVSSELKQLKQLLVLHDDDGQQLEHDHALPDFQLLLMFAGKDGEDENHQVYPA